MTAQWDIPQFVPSVPNFAVALSVCHWTCDVLGSVVADTPSSQVGPNMRQYITERLPEMIFSIGLKRVAPSVRSPLRGKKLAEKFAGWDGGSSSSWDFSAATWSNTCCQTSRPNSEKNGPPPSWVDVADLFLCFITVSAAPPPSLLWWSDWIHFLQLLFSTLKRPGVILGLRFGHKDKTLGFRVIREEVLCSNPGASNRVDQGWANFLTGRPQSSWLDGAFRPI